MTQQTKTVSMSEAGSLDFAKQPPLQLLKWHFFSSIQHAYIFNCDFDRGIFSSPTHSNGLPCFSPTAAGYSMHVQQWVALFQPYRRRLQYARAAMCQDSAK
ncbi:hypothetical protein BaRGS_00032636 [Batillaria attramentaria]|uniref:Uncharacterized protein n=1 Tax=Batillaria attramentaria TaxID=370345 RepID=A0ABD0JNA2_9CAEN